MGPGRSTERKRGGGTCRERVWRCHERHSTEAMRLLFTLGLASALAARGELELQSGHTLTEPAQPDAIDRPRVLVVKLAHTADRRSRERLEQLLPPGATVGPYLSHDAFAVRGRNAHLQAALAHSDHSSVFELQPQHKLAPELQRVCAAASTP